MTDPKKLLERGVAGFEPTSDALERTLRLVRRRMRRRRIVAGVVAFSLFAGAIVGLVLTFRPASKRASLGGQPVVTATFHVDTGVTDVAYGFGSLWVPGRAVLARIDPITGRVLATVRVPGTSDYRYVATGGGAVWVTDSGTGRLYRIDPVTNQLVATVPVGCPVAVSFGTDLVWVVNDEPCGALPATRVIRVDPSTNGVVGKPMPIGYLGDFSVGEGRVWIGNSDGGQLLRIDPISGRLLAKIPFDSSFPSPTTGYGALWVPHQPFVLRLDPSTGKISAHIPVLAPGGIAVGVGGVWVLSAPVSTEPGSLVLIDPTSNRTVGKAVRVGMTPVDVAVGGGAAWVANFYDETISRVQIVAAEPTPTPRVSPTPSPSEKTLGQTDIPPGFVDSVVVSSSRIRLVIEAPPAEVRWTFDGTSCSVDARWLKAPGGGAGGGGCSGDAYLSGSGGGSVGSNGALFTVPSGRTLPDRSVRIRVTLANGASSTIAPIDGLWMAVVQRCGNYIGTQVRSIEAIDSLGKVLGRIDVPPDSPRNPPSPWPPC